MTRHGHSRSFARASIALPLLYGIFLCAALALVFASNRQALLTKEEASSSFVNPVFLQFRLQHHLFSTNFYAYVFFWLTSHLHRTLFYGRFAKAVLMSTIPCWLYLYLGERFRFPAVPAFVAALSISLLPGILCFSWLGVDFGSETAVGLAALWLALFASPAAIVSSCVLAALSAGCYGGGLVFVAAVAAVQMARVSNRAIRRHVIAGLVLMAVIILFPLFWWTNAQTILAGGGRPELAGCGARLIALLREMFVHTDSYYFFGTGAAALGTPIIGILAVAGLLFAIVDARRTWPLLIICAASIAIYTAAGNVIGVRRAIPMVVCFGIFAALVLRLLILRPERWVRAGGYALFAIWLITGIWQWNALRSGLATGRIALPRDFDFPVAAGQTMVSTVSALLSRPISITTDLDGYEPDRTLCMLYLLDPAKPSREEIIAACDRHGWSIPSRAPRLMWLRRRLAGHASEGRK